MTILAFAILMLLTAPAHAQLCTTPTTTGLIGHWELDETSGTTAADSSGNSNDGTLTVTDFASYSVTAPIGTGLDMTGTGLNGPRIYVDNPTGTSGMTTFTIATWVNPSAFVSLNGVVSIHDLIDLEFSFNNNTVALSTTAWDTAGAYVATSPTIELNKWTHISVSFDYNDAVGTLPKVYINGQEAGTVGIAVAPAGSYNAPADPDIEIGAHSGSPNWFRGMIDDTRIYDRILDSEEIADLYKYGLGDEGSMVFNTDTDAMEYCDGTNWVHAGLGSYNANGVAFDGTGDELTLNSALSGVSATKKVTGSFWFNSSDAVDNDDIINISNGTAELFRISRNTNNSMNFVGEAINPTRELSCGSSAKTLGDWHHIIFSFDLSDTNKRHIYVNDASDLSVCFAYVNANMNPQNATNTTIGGFPDPNLDLADLWIEFGTYIDLSVEANRRKFISESGLPMYLGSDGSFPTGQSPDIFLSGGTENWHTNKGTGGSFTENGALTSASTKIGDNITYDPVSTTGLIGHWKLDETGATTTAVDSSGNGNNATMYSGLSGAGSVPGTVGTALQMNVPGDYNQDLGTADVATFGGLTAMSFSFWAKLDRLNGHKGLFDIPGVAFARYNWNNGDLRFGADGWSTAQGFWRATAGSQYGQVGEWQHVVITYDYNDPIGTRPVFYFDGVRHISMSQQNAPAGTYTPPATALVTIGQEGGSEFKGTLDDFRVYNRVLSADEAATLYNTCTDSNKGVTKYDSSYNTMTYCNGIEWVAMGPIGGTPPTSGLIGHWELDEIAGTTAADSSGNGYDGTYTDVTPVSSSEIAQIATGIDFNSGSGAQVTVPAHATFGALSEMTFSAWVKPKTHTFYSGFMGIGNANHSQGVGTFLLTSGTGAPPYHLLFFAPAWSTSYGGWRDNANEILADTWTHVTVTYSYNDAVGTAPRMYINGVETSTPSLITAAPSGTHTPPATESVDIGNVNFSGNRRMRGALDDARIYDRILTDTEIRQLYYYGLSRGLGDVDNACTDAGSITGATAEGIMFYNADFNVMQYCNGEEWIGIGQ